MPRPSAERSASRVAVLGAASPAGALVRSALAERGVDGARVGLYGLDTGSAVLSEYDGEARIVQPAGELDAATHGAVFVCEPGYDAEDLAAAAGRGAVVIDLSGSLPGAVLAGSASLETRPRLLIIPHPIAGAIATLLRPLHAALEIVGASVVVLRPAGDFGEAGLEELREQTVHLLRFERAPTEVFGRQLAFNVVPEPLFPAGESSASDRVVAELRALLGAPALDLEVSAALVPIFLGHAFAIHLRLARGGADEAAAVLHGAPRVSVARDGEAGCTMDAPDGPDVVVSRIVATGERSLRLWAVAAEAGRAAATRAIEVADAAGVV